MSQASHPAFNADYPLAITPPEEGALAAYNAVQSGLLAPFGIAHHDLPMDLAERIRTNGKAVAEASKYVRDHDNVIYVKGPGITPRRDQVISTIMLLEKNNQLIFSDAKLQHDVEELRKEKLSPEQFAEAVFIKLKTIGSPNAAWRSDLEANLARGTSDALAERSQVKPPAWSRETPLEVSVISPNAQNRQTGVMKSAGTLRVVYKDESGQETEIGSQPLSAGTPVRLYSADKASFMQWANHALDKVKTAGAQFAHGMKQTVLKTYDVALKGWLQEAIDAQKLNTNIAAYARDRKSPEKMGDLLVDDLFARLSTAELKEKMHVLSPNHSYAAYVHDVWEGVKARGGFQPAKHSEIVRASATGDHYKAIEYKAESSGTLEVRDGSGNVMLSKAMNKGDVAMVTHFDHERVKNMIRQTLDGALSSGRHTILFGFDDDGEYYSTARAALEDIRKDAKYKALSISVQNAADATVEYLTGVDKNGKKHEVKDTVLMLNNIFGDFATDIEINGKGTSYSVGRIYDNRGVVELGSGGTAPDLLGLWKETGTLLFNPMSFVEGISLALRFTAENMQKQGKDASGVLAVAQALEDGMYATTDKGIVPPIVKGKFRTNPDVKDYTLVSTQSFIQSVKVEAMQHLKGKTPGITDAEIARESETLAQMIARDSALFAVSASPSSAEWKAVNTAWNTAREQSGHIDLLNPDYSIPLPAAQGKAPLKLTPENLLALQKARAGVADAIANGSDAANATEALKAAYKKLGLESNATNEEVRADTVMLTPRRNSLAA